MSSTAKILSLAYNSAAATKLVALKTDHLSVRLIKETGTVSPNQPSYITNVLLNGKCIDPETRCLYVFYIDTLLRTDILTGVTYNSSWIIEINIDNRTQTVVYFDKYNAIGFDPLYKIYNAKVVHGRLVWTDNKNPIYQMDIARAKKSFYYKIGYGYYPQTVEWDAVTPYGIDQIVSNENSLYKSLIDANTSNEPRTTTGTAWERLCLIEDAYYSMNVENFYFEPMPPKSPPVVIYQSDNERKINNLKQTLFQFAYRYVYMDWRKSTLSPASIVPVPQAEEETATGLANEIVSLNNKLQITVNLGGEEVRAIEVIGRSSSDPSTWYLIETIDKLTTPDKVSFTTDSDNVTCSISVKAPVVLGASVKAVDSDINLGLGLPQPFAFNTDCSVSVTEMLWQYNEFGYEIHAQDTVVSCKPNATFVTAKPDWVTVKRGSETCTVGWEVANGDTLSIYIKTTNNGIARSGIVTIGNAYGDAMDITIIQIAAPPPVPIACSVLVDPDDEAGITIPDSAANPMSEDTSISMDATIHHPGYLTGASITVYWRIEVNGVRKENGTLSGVQNDVNQLHDLEPLQAFIAGDIVVIYLSSAVLPTLKSLPSNVPMSLQIPNPSVILSQVEVTVSDMTWNANEQGIGVAQTSEIDSKPNNLTLTSKPSWIVIRIEGGDGSGLPAGSIIYDGDVLSIAPNAINQGNIRTGYVVLTNQYGETTSISVTQLAVVVPPVGESVTGSVLADTNPSNKISVTYPESATATGASGSKNVEIDVTVDHSDYEYYDEVTVYWSAIINGISAGYGSVLMNNQISNLATLILNTNLQVGDALIIYLSSLP